MRDRPLTRLRCAQAPSPTRGEGGRTAFAGTTSEIALPAGPDVEHVAIFGAEVIDPALAGLNISAAVLAVDRNQRRLDVRLHLAAVAADINDRALLDQRPDAVLLCRDQILHVGFRTLAARERGVQFRDAIGGKALQFIGIE